MNPLKIVKNDGAPVVPMPAVAVFTKRPVMILAEATPGPRAALAVAMKCHQVAMCLVDCGGVDVRHAIPTISELAVAMASRTQYTLANSHVVLVLTIGNRMEQPFVDCLNAELRATKPGTLAWMKPAGSHRNQGFTGATLQLCNLYGIQVIDCFGLTSYLGGAHWPLDGLPDCS